MRLHAIRAVLAVCLAMGAITAAKAAPETTTVKSHQSFSELRASLEAAIRAQRMIIVTQACASCGAERRGIDIPGNLVMGVFRNDFAVRMLAASIPAGIEAPIRLYVTENVDGTASLHYYLPSAAFAPYGSPDLDEMAAELDEIWMHIVEAAVH